MRLWKYVRKGLLCEISGEDFLSLPEEFREVHVYFCGRERSKASPILKNLCAEALKNGFPDNKMGRWDGEKFVVTDGGKMDDESRVPPPGFVFVFGADSDSRYRMRDSDGKITIIHDGWWK
jgi:hypothetical protein